jgi:damage-control phosphatase, subfamily I
MKKGIPLNSKGVPFSFSSQQYFPGFSDMKRLQPIPQCTDCLMSLAKRVTALAGADDSGVVKKAEAVTLEILESAADNRLSSHQVAAQILREIKRLTGVVDPYKQFKVQEMILARELLAQIKSDNLSGLRSCVSLAILGNSLDFFKDPAEALAEIPAQLNAGVSYFYDDFDRLAAFIKKKPERVLYLSDNAGEVFFDIQLYEYIKARAQNAILVVKGKPSLNDLTRAELQFADLGDYFSEVADTGSDGVGIDWDNASKDFLDLVASSDLIIAKGMANFEAIYPKSVVPPVFFLFKVKCDPIHRYIQAPLGSFIALWKEGSSCA